MSESEKSEVEKAHEEWNYRDVENSFGMEYTNSYPCQLRFTETPTQDTDRFHEALSKRGHGDIDEQSDSSYKGDSIAYHGEIYLGESESYQRIKIRALRGNLVRIYPYDYDLPPHGVLQDIIEAVEEGFGAELEHYSIEEYEEDNE